MPGPIPAVRGEKRIRAIINLGKAQRIIILTSDV
jgi:hypothetical protein